MRLKLNEFKLVEVRNRLFFFQIRKFYIGYNEREMIDMFNKNRKEIKKLWIQLDRDKHLLNMLKEEYDISTDEFEQYVISNTIATIAKRIMAKRIEIEKLKG